ncbi:type III secretion system HrpB4-like protein [Paraburkholderia sp. BL23I1N1]|uniref:type III secretion protein HrpB4 n=1 Tax=Paraburkholderia sp. BL23I1N1 TaxID=1938802 RepID=UPI000E726D4A|nr:type III secretion protein HrpB4 [Paraburkholderia sp. BL23I1N1]RKE40052.1 type III secretion system HrpB4-like protein [Paraburkholderia sp. BL23I1N1]
MNAPTDLPFMRVAAALDSYRRNLASTAHWADPSWSAAMLGANAAQLEHWRGALTRAGAAAVERCSQALAEAAGVKPPSFATLTQTALKPTPAGTAQPNAVLLDVLPVHHALQVLRMRALSFRRAEARRLIDKRTRSQLSEWTGVGIDRLTQDAHLADAPDIARLAARAAMPPLTALDAGSLAVEGCALLLRDLGGAQAASGANVASDPTESARVPFPLLRLALPRVLPTPAWLASVPEGLDAPGSARLFARLSDLLPEFAWLFG